MAYLSLIRIPGDPDELISGHYERMGERMRRIGPENGLIAHAACRTDEGMVVMNLWQSKEGSEATAKHPEIQEARQQSGVSQDEVRFEHYDVENYEVFGE